MWLLQYEWSHYNDSVTEMALYSTKEKAIESFPDFMDQHSMWSDDWKNGLKGFGKEDKENYLGFDYLVDEIGDDGGVLLTNTNADTGGGMLTVDLKRMQVNPPKEKKHEPVEEEQENNSYVFY